ncbi:probable E3 ubiquitin-protein ligase TRIML1 [Monodelphis domestica]|uniref:probable E3 ubiquitin-protein ligase TRIML1 n=1 Tax=Monodelphis domestica TaxID=13616 RepID=UPI0024E21657|nr:probable E3 ubiquitin-protein ligase TRIML1 [Monodelphis domestica]
MDTRDLIENLKANLTCSICLGYFTDPVIVKCGHNFCRVCLLRCREEADTTLNCPECRGVIEDRDVVPNRKLENLSMTGKRLRPHLLESMVDLYVCDQHGEKEKLFCEEDQRLLCDSCVLAPGHKDHTVLPLEMAAHKCKDKIKHTLNTLQRKKEEYNVALDRVGRRGRLCGNGIHSLKESVILEYRKLREFLCEEEELYLQSLDQRHTDNVVKLENNKAKLLQKIQNLEKMKIELEENLDKEPLEMLQDMKDTLARNEELLLQEPEVASFAWATRPITGLTKMLKRFQRDISFDPKSANPHLILSEDMRGVKYEDVPQDLPDNKERFNDAIAVLGAQTFTSGKHYWEVKLGNKTELVVGVCKDSIRRKGRHSSSSKDFWILVSFRLCNDCFLWNYRDGFLMSQPLEKMGIFLDYDKKHVAFYDAIDGSLICSFSDLAFEGPLRPYFSFCHRKEKFPASIVLINMGDSQ